MPYNTLPRPAVALMHAFVTDLAPDLSLDDVFIEFASFPGWVWSNHPTRDFLLWLKQFNLQLAPHQRCGIFGLDLYSLNSSMASIIEYLTQVDPSLANEVKDLYSCFDKYQGSPHLYGKKCHWMGECKEAVVKSLQRIVDKTHEYARPNNGIHTQDYAFINEMNARLVVDAENYYRTMFDTLNDCTWEIRDEVSNNCCLSSFNKYHNTYP